MCKYSVGVKACVKILSTITTISDDNVFGLSLCILVHSPSVHTERRRAISECEPLERRRRPGG